MRKLILLAVVVAALVALPVGVALAQNFKGTDGMDTIVGTAEDDTISGFAGNDNLLGRQGNDTIRGNRGDDDIVGQLGRDRIDGGRGDDHIDVQADGSVDTVDCGAGIDVARANPKDNVAANCEFTRAIEGTK